MAKSPELDIIPDGPHLNASESVVHMLAELNRRLEAITEVNDRYREAMRAIGELPWCGTCAPGYNAIVSAALDGEG